jgi:hypothetical protein
MESNCTMTSGAVEMTSPHARVWRDRLQPGTRLLADLVITLPGTTLPMSSKSGVVGQIAVQGAGVPAFATSSTARTAMSINYVDVPPFRTGRPPV